MKNKTKMIFFTALIFMSVCITVYVYSVIPKPDQFVLDYLNARYTDTNYLSIAQKAEQQKPFLKEKLINSDFMFGKFDEEINYFTEQKYIKLMYLSGSISM